MFFVLFSVGFTARGFFVEPTVVAGLRQDDEMVQREIFGPVVTVQRFSSDDEAIGLMHRQIGGYSPGDIEVVAAFDIDRRKVGRPVEQAIFARPNCAMAFNAAIPPTGDVVLVPHSNAGLYAPTLAGQVALFRGGTDGADQAHHFRLRRCAG